ncbi:MAG: hypothetical protein HN826_08865 [Methylococcales bacterium]|jgi:hypothetical protein|nr:hypothetical protein [Methylococcales bacterium]
MKKLTTTLLLLIISQSTAFAKGIDYSRFFIDFNIDNGKINPSAFLPYYWNDNIFSGIGIHTSTTQDNGTVSGFSDSRIGSSVQDNRLKLNLLSYEMPSGNIKYNVGGDIEQIDIDKLEFGFLQMPTNLGGDLVAFDNQINIKVLRPTIHGDITWNPAGGAFSIRTGANLYPISSLTVDQETRFKPIISSTGTSSGSKDQDLSYSLNLEMIYKTTTWADFLVTADYEFLPLKYDLAVLSVVNNQFVFTSSSIDTEDTTLRYSFRIVLKKLMDNLRPVIGYNFEKVKSKDKTSGSSSSKNNNFLVIGIENRF